MNKKENTRNVHKKFFIQEFIKILLEFQKKKKNEKKFTTSKKNKMFNFK